VNDPKVLDLNQFGQLKELMGLQFDKLVKIFQKNSQELLSDMQKSFTSSDSHLGRMSAHSLKSSSASFGLLLLSEQTEKMEEIWRQGLTPSNEDMVLTEKTLKDSLAAIETAMSNTA
jgi:HPt (histidine-containing phosphotransfer) domain-containing protein